MICRRRKRSREEGDSGSGSDSERLSGVLDTASDGSSAHAGLAAHGRAGACACAYLSCHPPLVNVSQCETELNEPVEDLFLREMLALLILDERGEVAAVAVVHHDVEQLAVEERLAVAHDERMMKLRQQFDLLHGA